MVTSRLVILTTCICVAYAYPTHYEKNYPAGRDLNTAETIWDIFGNQGGRGYSGWGTGVQSSPVIASPYTYSIPSYPASYGAYPTYATYGGNNYYGGKYPTVGSIGTVGTVGSAYPGYANSFPTYENYAVHGGHGFGKYGKY